MPFVKAAAWAFMLLGGVSAASADHISLMKFDIKGVTVESYLEVGADSYQAGFGGSDHTGYLLFSHDINTTAHLFQDGHKLNDFTNAALNDLVRLSGRIDLDDGVVTSGWLDVGLKTNNVFETYKFELVPNVGMLSSITVMMGELYALTGVTRNGVFSSATYGGANLDGYKLAGLDGVFLNFGFMPSSGGVDHNAILEFGALMPLETAVVPLPAAAWGGLALMGALLSFRLKRQHAKAR